MADTHPMRTWRKENGKTLADMAELVGVVPSYLSDIERFLKQPSLDLAAKLQDETGIPATRFLKSRAAQ
jgi:transcriptional regulator with XRE-family HTH domain